MDPLLDSFRVSKDEFGIHSFLDMLEDFEFKQSFSENQLTRVSAFVSNMFSRAQFSSFPCLVSLR